MTSPALAFVSFVLYVALVSGHWVNNYDDPARLECEGNNAYSFIGSIHSDYYEDRRWQFQCKSSPHIGDCYWTDYLNDFDQPLMFNCPDNRILNGMDSYHNNYYEDRRFKVKCCTVPDKQTRNCRFTGYINDWDGEMSYNVPEGGFIKGVYSVHDNYREDRIWKINFCQLL